MSTDPAWTLVAPHRDRLVRMARRRVGNAQDAEDIASEALLRVATFPTLDHARVGEMLTTVTVRLCADLAYRRGVEARALPKIVEAASDPFESLLDDAEARFLATVPLTKIERTLLVARIHGLYPSEVAASLGLTVPSAKRALDRARAKILKAWRTTLGVFGVTRLRRTGPAGGVVVVVALALTLMPSRLPSSQGSALPLTAPRREDTPVRHPATAPSRPVVVRPVVSAQPERRAVVRPAPSPSPAPHVVKVPPLTAKGAGVHGHRVEIDTNEGPVARVQRCVRNGFDFDPRTMSLTCR